MIADALMLTLLVGCGRVTVTVAGTFQTLATEAKVSDLHESRTVSTKDTLLIVGAAGNTEQAQSYHAVQFIEVRNQILWPDIIQFLD